ncbi:unnamed protein product [Paramecium octaurelia]|uniref:Uncharacterized protein n=1 Tax=Paramecium octaurelia TaxID=43137 RepID=A0A8S1TBJ2_PAROT|nr:unnamed protein product [Paramecium octaurelia]
MKISQFLEVLTVLLNFGKKQSVGIFTLFQMDIQEIFKAESEFRKKSINLMCL